MWLLAFDVRSLKNQGTDTAQQEEEEKQQHNIITSHTSSHFRPFHKKVKGQWNTADSTDLTQLALPPRSLLSGVPQLHLPTSSSSFILTLISLHQRQLDLNWIENMQSATADFFTFSHHTLMAYRCRCDETANSKSAHGFCTQQGTLLR